MPAVEAEVVVAVKNTMKTMKTVVAMTMRIMTAAEVAYCATMVVVKATVASGGMRQQHSTAMDDDRSNDNGGNVRGDY